MTRKVTVKMNDVVLELKERSTPALVTRQMEQIVALRGNVANSVTPAAW
jgi:hypothetical protein